MEEYIKQNNIILEAREFASNEIRPFAGEFEENGGIPRELINKMAQKGYLAASLPEKYGGLALNPVDYGFFTEEIGKACASTRSILTVHTSLVGETILRWGNEQQKDYWLPLMAKGEKLAAFALSEPDVGSNAKGVQTSYVKQGDKYILNGRKKWITLGGIADVFIVIASEQGKITAFIVERSFPGVSTSLIKGMLSGKASYISEIRLDNVEVPEENVLGKVGNAFEYVVATALDHGRYSIAWAGVGIAQEALDAMVTYSRNRTQFGEKLRSFQLVRGMIGDAVTKIHAARALCIRAGEMRQQRDSDAIVETTIAKYFTSKVAMEVANDAVQIHGGNGCCSDYPVERLFREARVLEIIEGTSQLQQEIIANYGLTKYYKRKKLK